MKWDDRLDRYSARLPQEAGRRYAEAVERIHDFTADPENPYWHAPGDGSDGVPGEATSNDEMGGEELPEDMRDRAWELIVLADLIDAASRADGDGAA